MKCVGKSKSGVTLSIVVLLSLTSVSLAVDWPYWRGPNHDGISTETDWDPTALNDPIIAWKADIGTGYSAVSVANGKAYTAGNVNKNKDVIFCFDAETGKEIWTYKYAESLTPKNYAGGCNVTPIVHDGKLYFMSKTGKVFCLDAETGHEIWKKILPYDEPRWGYASSPLIVDSLVILNVGDSGVALNKDTGGIVWKSENKKSGYASAVPFEKDGVKYIALFAREEFKVVETLTGNVKMTYPWKTDYDINAADPIISGDEILITSGYGHGAALLKMAPNGLTQVWENKNMRSRMSGPVLINGYLYGIDDKQLVCVDWKTGRQIWADKTPREGSLCAAGDKLIVIGEKGKLYILQATPDGFKELSSAQLLSVQCWTMPVLSNGRIYVRNTVREKPDTLICVDVRKK